MTEMENMKKLNIEANERKSGDKDVLIKKRNTDGKKKKLHNVVKRDVFILIIRFKMMESQKEDHM